MSLNVVNGEPSGPGSPSPARQLDAAAAHGVRLGRADAFWSLTEKLLGHRRYFDWTRSDRTATEFARRQIRWWPVLDYSPAWATSVSGTDHAPPARAEDFAAYGRAFALRYGAHGAFWRLHPKLPRLPVAAYEIWNEPDSILFWKPAPSPSRYLDLYLRAREAIKGVDADTPVVVGGLTNNPEFLTTMVRPRPAVVRHLDGVAIHPYDATPEAVLANVRAMRQTLDALGGNGVPLFVTEIGWVDKPPTARFYADSRQKASFLTRTIRALARSDCGVGAVFVYSWTTAESDPRRGDDWFGVYGSRGEETPSSRALAALLHAAGSKLLFSAGPPAAFCRGFAPPPVP
jgi:hypothetical protein